METATMTTTNNPPHDAGHTIRAWRQRVGLTQEGLAQALSVTFSTVSRWENGHVLPSKLAWRALQQLASERGIPLEPEKHTNGNGTWGDS
jgi:putative transcriptional regulator